MAKKVLITGVTGQDGSYFVDFLLKETDHIIYGMVRRLSTPNTSYIKHNIGNLRFKLVTGDLSDSQSIDDLINQIKPDYFINLGAQSFVAASWDIPEQTFDIDAMGVIRCLEAIRKHAPTCRFYNAGSSEEMGDVLYSPQNENHPPRARSVYGASKIAARQIVKVYRESYSLFAIQGLLYNHESERRGEEFITRKITKGVARIYHAIKNNRDFEPIEVGNLEVKRDWSYAPDFIVGIWAMINQKTPKEFILSSGETHTVREFIGLAFKEANLYGYWKNEKENEEFILGDKYNSGINIKSVVINPKFYRPADVESLCGDSSLARKELGWTPKVVFNELIKKMVKYDIENYGK